MVSLEMIGFSEHLTRLACEWGDTHSSRLQTLRWCQQHDTGTRTLFSQFYNGLIWQLLWFFFMRKWQISWNNILSSTCPVDNYSFHLSTSTRSGHLSIIIPSIIYQQTIWPYFHWAWINRLKRCFLLTLITSVEILLIVQSVEIILLIELLSTVELLQPVISWYIATHAIDNLSPLCIINCHNQYITTTNLY